MDKQLGKQYSAEERVAFLRDNSDKVEKMTYLKRYTADELRQRKDQLSEVSISISEIEDEKKEAMKDIRERMDPLKDEKKVLLGNIKRKGEEVKEECYKMIDRDTRMVGYYNGEGDLIEERPAYPDEQTTIFSIQRTGTEG